MKNFLLPGDDDRERAGAAGRPANSPPISLCAIPDFNCAKREIPNASCSSGLKNLPAALLNETTSLTRNISPVNVFYRILFLPAESSSVLNAAPI
jgi:hypothetical protein